MKAEATDVKTSPKYSSSQDNSSERAIDKKKTRGNHSRDSSPERQNHHSAVGVEHKRNWRDSHESSRQSSRENPLVTLRKKVSERRKQLETKEKPTANETKMECVNFDGKSNSRRVYVREDSPIPRKASSASLKEYSNHSSTNDRHGKRRRNFLVVSNRGGSPNKRRGATDLVKEYSKRKVALTKTAKENRLQERHHGGQTKRPRYSEDVTESTEDTVGNGYHWQYDRQQPEDSKDPFAEFERPTYNQEWNDMNPDRYERDCLWSPKYYCEERANVHFRDEENVSEITEQVKHSSQYFPETTDTQSVLPVRQFPLENKMEVTFELTTYKTQVDRDELAAEILGVLISSGNKQTGEELNTEISETLRLAFVDAENLKEFLLLYPTVFEVKDIDFEEDEEGVVSDSYFVAGKTNVGLCQNTGACENMCSCLHVCKFWLLSGTCINQGICYFGHTVDTAHNLSVLQMHGLHRLNDDGLRFLLKGTNNRTAGTVPRICSYYNALIGCRNVENCPYLHVCHHFVYRQCKFENGCKRTHDLCSDQPNHLLKLYGLDSATLGESTIYDILRRFNAPPRSTSTDNWKQRCPTQSTKVIIPKDSGHAITVPHDTIHSGGHTDVWDWHLEGHGNIFDTISADLEIMYQEYVRSKTRTIIVNEKRMRINFETMEAVFLGENQEMKIFRNKVPDV